MWTSSLTYLIICFGVLVGIGNGFGYATPIPVMAKWFPDKRGLAVGLAVAGYGGGSAIFGPMANLWLIPTYGWRSTFVILGLVFFVMTLTGSFLLKNPPVGYRPAGWAPAPAAKAAATTHEFTPGEMWRTPTAYLMWIAYALGTSAGLMVISQLVPFAKSMKIPGEALAAITLVIGAAGNASGRIFSGWMSDALGRLNVLRLMIGVSAVSMPILFLTGGNVALLYVMVFVVYWCYGTQLSVNASTTSDFWGTKNVGVNYGLLFTAWGVAGFIGPRIGGALFDKYKNYEAAFYVAAGLAVVALLCELLAKRPASPVEAAFRRASRPSEVAKRNPARHSRTGKSAAAFSKRIFRRTASGSGSERNSSTFWRIDRTPIEGQSVPQRTRSATSGSRGRTSRSFFGGIPEMSSRTFGCLRTRKKAVSYQRGRPAWQRTIVVSGKVDRHVVARHRIGVDVPGAGEDGRPGVDQDRPLRLAGQPVDVGERRTVGPVGVGGHLHVGRVDLDGAEAVDLEELPHLPGDVASVPGVDPADRHEPVPVTLHVAGDPGIHEVGEPHDLGRNGSDQDRPRDPLGVHRLQKLVGRGPDPPDEIGVVAPVQQGEAGPLLQLVVRTDVEMGVEDREGRESPAR